MHYVNSYTKNYYETIQKMRFQKMKRDSETCVKLAEDIQDESYLKNDSVPRSE